MVNQQLLDYINQEKQKGFSDEQIKTVLLQNGYGINEIDESLKPIKPNSSKNKIIILASIIILIVLIFSYFFIANKVLTSTTKLKFYTPEDRYMPNSATIENQLTFFGDLSIKKGSSTTLKNSFFNSKNETLENIQPLLINCNDEIGKEITQIGFMSTSIKVSSNSEIKFASIISVNNLDKGKYTCDLVVSDVTRKIEINVV